MDIVHVALRKESVDRNSSAVIGSPHAIWSLSARRAWIEIAQIFNWWRTFVVALRKESVDRNFQPPRGMQVVPVALRKESVDRNQNLGQCLVFPHGRSPQGERG